ncbi:protein HASTY 1-like [Apium graveolens]|uniref:protein HASTY 1-like n=1 Tax=Apium graveolens TaxID=4045 RepID=UPI003D7BA828
MEDSTNTARNVAQAIVAVLEWNCPPDTRKAAVSFLESVKAGDVRVLANTSVLLVKKDWSSEIRIHALKLMQHVVRLRWDELSPTERREFTNVAIGLLSEVAGPCEVWALKSQTAALIAEVVRREGLSLWQELLPSLVSLSTSGPLQAELVSIILRWLPEDITVHNEDLEGDRRRLLLRGLTDSLPEILPLLYSLLERHFGAALSEAGRQQMDTAKQHAAAVTSILNAINAYADWAPLPDLSKYGIIHGCSFLLSSPDFRLHACDFFKLVSSRKRPVDADAEFDSAISSVVQVLMNVSREFLSRTGSHAATIDESEFEYFEYISESMVSLGTYNLKCISGDSTLIPFYLQQMLGYFQHFKLELHYQTLFFWLALLRDLLSKPKVIQQASADSSLNNLSSGPKQADDGKMNIVTFLTEDIYSIMLEISFQRMLKKERVHSGTAHGIGALELWSDDIEGKGEFSQYRSRLTELIRLIASSKPLIAATKVSEKILMIINAILLDPTAQNFAVMESMQFALDNVVSVIYDGSTDYNNNESEMQVSLGRIFEGLLQQLLYLKWTESTFVELLGHYLDAMGPFLKYHADGVGSVVHKLFELLNSLPFVVTDPATSTARHARLQICTSFIRIAKTAGKSLLPHMKAIADTMSYLQKEGGLLRGEHNLLGEAFLIMASAAGVQQQQEVLVWLLEPLSKQWIQIEWQNEFLSDPNGLVRLCSDTKFMWSLFHTVTFFEKALKRSGARKGSSSLLNTSAENNVPCHPMASHLSWMLPPLLKLLRAIHSLWSQPVIQALPGDMKAAMVMSDVERTSLLGEGPKSSRSALNFIDGSQFDTNKEGSAESNEIDIRNWLKGIRDSGYNVLGLSTTIGDSFFKTMDAHFVALALVENVQSMEFRHMRQLVHSIYIPLVKCCPSDMWELWLEKLLHPIFLYSQQALSCSWSSLLQEGRAKVPDHLGIPADSDLKVEVMEEKLLRGLTREICTLLSILASQGLNTGLPLVEQSGHVSRVEVSALKELDAFSSSSMIAFLLKHKGLALLALQIVLDTFKWGDGEAVTKVSSFCGSIVLLAVSSSNAELREFVAKDLFYAIISSLEFDSNKNVSAELVGLCREIFVYLSERDPAPRQLLLSLPCITPQDLLAFEEALAKTSSPKEQKQHMRSLLLLATGNKLKALANLRSVGVITNVSARPRSLLSAPEPRNDEGPIGLAAIM